jgi:AcrR family transcriptional regulator
MSRRDRNLADIRERATILAEQIILERGVSALSARRLAASLQVSVGSLYNAFGDLDQVIRAVTAICADMLQDHLRHAVDTAPDDKKARVVALGEAYFDFAMAEPERWSLMFEYRSDMQLDPKAHGYQMGLLDMLVRAGGADPASDQHRQFFLLLWASVHGLVSLACRPNIVAINPDIARTYIGDLVQSAFNAFPID